MARRRVNVLAVEAPVAAETMRQLLEDNGPSWDGLQVELDAERGQFMLTARRRRPAQALAEDLNGADAP